MLIWVVRNSGAESQVAAQWLVRRFIDPQARCTSPDDFSPSQRRNGTAAPDRAVKPALAELTSFDLLLKQHGLATDPALLFLSDIVRLPHLADLLASTAPTALRAALAVSGPDTESEQQAFDLLDSLYEWLREQVQKDLDRR